MEEKITCLKTFKEALKKTKKCCYFCGKKKIKKIIIEDGKKRIIKSRS